MLQHQLNDFLSNILLLKNLKQPKQYNMAEHIIGSQQMLMQNEKDRMQKNENQEIIQINTKTNKEDYSQFNSNQSSFDDFNYKLFHEDSQFETMNEIELYKFLNKCQSVQEQINISHIQYSRCHKK